jgi:hypothetical protein
VYKPIVGEQPLWDFAPGTLSEREVLTYEVDRVLGFGVVPETVHGSGPLGPGAVQRFIDDEPSFDPIRLIRDGDDRLWPIALLDLVTNNADRKAGHILLADGSLVAVDHGLTFHRDDKLRTVLWAFAGRPIPDEGIDALRGLADALDVWLAGEIADRLGTDAANATVDRVRSLLAKPVHPFPPEDRPATPWPPY